MGGRVVEGNGLENRRGCEPFVSSNLTPSAIKPLLRRETLVTLALELKLLPQDDLGLRLVIF